MSRGRLSSDAAAFDVLQLVIAMSTTWATTAPDMRTLGGRSPAARMRAHRATLVTSVAAIVESLGHVQNDVAAAR
jgi:hypothetical protein